MNTETLFIDGNKTCFSDITDFRNTYLTGNKTLTKIYMTNTTILPILAIFIVDIFKHHPIEIFYIKQGWMFNNSVKILSAIFENNNLLKKIKMDAVSYSCKQDLELMLNAIKNTRNLCTLSLKKNNISDEGMYIVEQITKNNLFLEKINLGWNCFGSNGVRILSNIIENNKSLIKLHLQCNYIGDDGAISISETLKYNTGIKSILLNYNYITDIGASAFAETLKKNECITNLNLFGNKIENEGAIALIKSLRYNNTLRKINLGFNNLDADGIHKIKKEIKHNLYIEKTGIRRIDDMLTEDYILAKRNMARKKSARK